MDIFGPKFNMTNIEFSVGQTNVNYGGFDYQADKVNESSTLVGAEPVAFREFKDRVFCG